MQRKAILVDSSHYNYSNVDVNTSGDGDGHNSHHHHQQQMKWQTIIPGEVTCISGAGSCLHPDDDTTTGLCVIGCLDGSLHVLSLACGVHLGVPLVLGATVAYVDVHTLSTPSGRHGNNSDNDSSHHGDYPPPRLHEDDVCMRVLAVTADGEVYHWDVSASTGRLKSTCRTNIRSAVLAMKSRSHSEGAMRPTIILRADIKTNSTNNNTYTSSASTATTSNRISARDGINRSAGSSTSSGVISSHDIHPHHRRAVVSADDQNNNNNTTAAVATSTATGSTASHGSTAIETYSVTVEKIILNARGNIELYALRKGTSAVGGDWQGFCFCSDAQAWTRLVDMRHVLSRCDPYSDQCHR